MEIPTIQGLLLSIGCPLSSACVQGIVKDKGLLFLGSVQTVGKDLESDLLYLEGHDVWRKEKLRLCGQETCQEMTSGRHTAALLMGAKMSALIKGETRMLGRF